MKNLFTVLVHPNREDAFKEHFLKKIKIEGLDNLVGEIFLPEDRSMSKKVENKKLYPGYAFIEIETNEKEEFSQDIYYLIKNIKEFRGFIMSGNKPITMTAKERDKFEKLAKQASESGVLSHTFNKDDKIKINDGPFLNFEGKFESMDHVSGKATVIINVFGRATAVELPVDKIEKLT